MKRWLVLLVFLLSIGVSHSLDLTIINPSLRLYNVTSYIDNEGNLVPVKSINLAIDYENNFPDKDKTFMQIDNEITQINNDGMVNLLEGTTNGNVIIPTPIKNNIKFRFSSKRTGNFSVLLSNNIGIIHYENDSEYPGWYCIDDGNLKQLSNLSINNIEIDAYTNGLYYYKYFISSDDYNYTCNILPKSVSSISLIEIENATITYDLDSGYLSHDFSPGDHHLILYSYNKDGSIYNATRDFFVVINECGDLKCDINEDCPFDCNVVRGNEKENDDEEIPEKARFILTITTNNLRKERGENYLVFDLGENQYEAKISLIPTKDSDFYIEDYNENNVTDLFSYQLDGSILGNDVVKVKANKKYSLAIRVDKLKSFNIGDNYGIFDFGGIMQMNYKVVMPRALYSQLRFKPVTDSRTKRFISENKKMLVILLILLAVMLIILYYRKKRIKKTIDRIKLKYGIDIEDL